MGAFGRYPGAFAGVALALLVSGCPADFHEVTDAGDDGAPAEASGADATGPDGGGEGDATRDGPEGSSDVSPGDAMGASPIDGADAACVSECSAGQTRCRTNEVQACQVGTDGCAHWITTAMCGAHQACSTSMAGAASCACVATACTQKGNQCQDSQTLATCAQDTDGCLFVMSTSPCSSPQACSGMAPNAACSLTCTDSCSNGQTACVSGGLATCTLGGNGCRSYGTPAPCGSHQSCTGSSGSAACTCDVDPNCMTAGAHCTSSSSYVTCQTDMTTGCIYSGGTTNCSATQQCTGGTCQDTCGPSSCASGCCNGTTCEAYTSQSTSMCGTGGVPCSACTSPSGATCSSGVCGCPTGEQNCTGTCVNTQAGDTSNCGMCGHACPTLVGIASNGPTCGGGVCQGYVGGYNPGSTGSTSTYPISVAGEAIMPNAAGTLVSLGARLTNSDTSSPSAQLALYEDDGSDNPGTLIFAGHVTVPANISTAQILTVSSGTYSNGFTGKLSANAKYWVWVDGHDQFVNVSSASSGLCKSISWVNAAPPAGPWTGAKNCSSVALFLTATFP